MSINSRIERLERDNAPESCPLCQSRKASVNVCLPAGTEELIDAVPMNCPKCGREIIINIVYVESRRE